MSKDRDKTGGRSSAGQLRATLTRFEDAREPDIIYRSVRWPEFEDFLLAVKALKDASDSMAESRSVREDLGRWFETRDVLMSSFVEPCDPSLGLDDETSWGPIAAGELGRLQNIARETVRALRVQQHQGLRALEQMISNQSRIQWPKIGQTRVVVKSRAVSGTLAALESLPRPEGLSWEVTPLFAARRSGSCDVTVILGPPERHTDWRTPLAERSRHIAWLFNSPMSPHVVVITWGGATGFDAANYESNPGNPRLDPRIVADTGFPRDLRAVLFDEDDVPPVWTPNGQRPSQEAVRSWDFLLPDNYWISYGIDAGPYPTRIPLDSEYEIDIDDEHRASEMEVGDIFVLFEGSEERELRDTYCAQWVKEHRATSFAVARKTVTDYKAAIWSRRHDSKFKSDLIKAGLRDDYAQAQISRSNPADPAMGPRDEERFLTVAKVAGWEPPKDAWEHFRLLRGGYMHAGRRIRDQLRAIVQSDHGWQDEIIAKRIAVLDVPDLGKITLAPILAIAPDESLRDLDDLGRLRRR
jgi:hypothetical protein